MNRPALITGAIFCALSVALGAFGSHVLDELVTAQRLDTWQTAAHYLMTQGLGLLIIGLLSHAMKFTFKLQTRLLIVGTILFCASLFSLVIFNLPILGAIAPIGGILMIAGWGALAITIAKRTK